MKLPDDFRDLLVCLADAHVDFLIVGGFAVAHHGHVRATKDIDILVRASAHNASRVMQALVAFGAKPAALTQRPNGVFGAVSLTNPSSH